MSPTRLSDAASIVVLGLTVLVGVASAVAIVLGRLSPAAAALQTTLVGYVAGLFISPRLAARRNGPGR